MDLEKLRNPPGGSDTAAPLGNGGQEMGRRRFLKGLGGGAALAAFGPAAGTLLSGCSSSPTAAPKAGPTTETGLTVDVPPAGISVGGRSLRPPAIPLAVRGPYVSSWLAATDLTEVWASGLGATPTPFCGLVRVDGHSFQWCGAKGAAGSSVTPMTQTGVEVTPTRSIFAFEGGGVRLVAEWLSPIEPGNPRLQSVPLALVTVTVSSTDSVKHDVELYCDADGQWASWVDSAEIKWQTTMTHARHWTAELASQQPLTEQNQMAAWGTAVFSTVPAGSSTTYQSGGSGAVRARFVSNGTLTDTSDPNFRPVDEDTPVFALAHRLGSVGSSEVSAYFSIGHFQSPAVEYLGRSLEPLWRAHWPSWQAMVDDFLTSAEQARSRAATLDSDISSAAEKVGGTAYSALCALALRQAYGACQLVTGPNGRPWAFLKEISSDDDISTADIIFDSCPVWLYLDPGYLEMLLEPLLEYASSSHWAEAYAPHSLGFWPVASGNPAGAASEPMPIGDSGAMLVMAAAYASSGLPATTVKAFLSRYESLWTRWANLLVTQLPKPPAQLTTVDYLGHSTGNTNLAVLALAGLGGAAQIAALLGDSKNASTWSAKAKNFSPRSMKLAADPAGGHLDAEMGVDGTWSDLYNAFWDKALGTGLVPDSVAAEQAAYYRSHLDAYGLAVESNTPTIARLDQQLLTAAWLYEYRLGPELVEILAKYVGHTNYRYAMPDTYDPQTGDKRTAYNWWARPVVGGMYALLLVSK
jgi:hypothetical protein